MPETIALQREMTPDRVAVSDDLLPIREVARLTGVNPVTLRAWERRYGLIQPIRTESGHRLYSRTDIDTVHRILDWIERGVAVSKVGKILARGEPLGETGTAPGDGLEWAQWHGQLRSAISAFDDRQLDRLYGQIFSAYPLAVVFQDILMPLWQSLLRHQGRFGQASEWLFFDNFLRSRTAQRLQVIAATPLPRVLLAAIAGECRELELLVAGLLLTGEKLAVKLLGVGQPFDELTLVCEKTQPQALVLFSNRAPGSELPLRLKRLALTLDCPLLLAGDAADLAQDSLAGSSIGCLGNEGRLMQRRLQQFLSGGLDT
ncbi:MULTISPECIES: MerR family transcriptional regulator [Pseudomonas]|jgi:DNA-binding transcriptional MerR regulator|uniref:MerR family transcriptional regulator n=1 Tax=Pseudomonas pergaminensis TaxID=2853159 RepID=A0ABD7TFL8_9PSED|nr:MULTISPECIES: MerR family transcriptional regulator [Pseudomonas]PIB49023.1 MerR family transcriptional regulator [Pseudomonas sp. 2588-5]AQT96400.1 helix-turn-helix-type transcriptional regulator [Pseudomonas azotoformans]MBT1261789.1 MerR family transcriptional regulator [Pseudomonas sp. VS40]MBT1273197.1 MerR family transcriptional regulator [Pseudomonas sp. VS59]UMY48521.1 MerR family transcriptional regulator [Pseudomonas azotoformans]